ncbi:hypothetical protein [Endozoicomonas numazuensis]|uniref:Lipoprotein n=1 Tax=Endozoicomonas numazuensis TaxID=1137799 RepID=A0A081NJH7_9GAMM|nr:hypothetical protein [Endozoicomonas numazuensis]KEQ18600.1 hypothetical protein GZ78_00180 [Endozoicomonas numazuensis]
MRSFRAALVLLTAFLLGGCAATTVQNNVHHSYSSSESEREKVKKILIVPSDVVVKELGVGSVEEVPEWTDKGKKLVDSELKAYMNSHLNKVSWVPMPELTEEEQAILNQHIVLYDLVAGNALTITNIEAFKSETESPDDTLGSGLSFLKEKSGADSVLLTFGADFVSSGGRVMTAVLLAAAGVVIPGGHAVLNTGLIDLETGDVIWTNTSLSTSISLKDDKGAKSMVEQTLSAFPSL